MEKVINKILKSKRCPKKIEKKCKFPGCEIIFSGIYISKYCLEHRQGHYRVRKLIEYDDINKQNQTVIHEHNAEIIRVEMICALKECSKKFCVEIFPTQKHYPKYCLEHRNEYKRLMYLKINNQQVVC
jgi:hypothetical protein